MFNCPEGCTCGFQSHAPELPFNERKSKQLTEYLAKLIEAKRGAK